jgi:hypothetical protein
MRTAFRTSKAERSAEHACKCSSALSRGKQDWMTGAIGTVVRLKPLASGRLNWSTCQRPQRRAPEFGLWLRCFRHRAHLATLLCLARGERSPIGSVRPRISTVRRSSSLRPRRLPH